MGSLPASLNQQSQGSAAAPPAAWFNGSVRWLRERLADLLTFEAAVCFFIFSVFIGDSPFLPFIPYKMALSFVLSAGGAVILFLRGRMRRDSDAGILMLLMLAFIGWIFTTTLWTPSVNYANTALMRLLGLSAWLFTATAMFISGDPQRQRRFYAGLAIIGCYLAWETVLFYLSLARGGGSGFLRPYDIDYLSLARAVGTAALITAYYAIYERKWPAVWRVACGAALLLLHVLVLMIGARTALVATLLCGMVLWLPRINFGRNPAQLLRNVLIALAITAALALAGMKLLGSSRIEDSLTGVRRIMYILDAGFASNDRYIRYAVTWEGLERNPVFGNGVGSWAILNGYGDVKEYPHNFWLDVWYELGLPGVIIALAYFWWGVRRFWPPGHWLNQPYAPLTLALFGTGFISSQFSNNYNESWLMYCMLGMLLMVPIKNRRTI